MARSFQQQYSPGPGAPGSHGSAVSGLCERLRALLSTYTDGVAVCDYRLLGSVQNARRACLVVTETCLCLFAMVFASSRGSPEAWQLRLVAAAMGRLLQGMYDSCRAAGLQHEQYIAWARSMNSRLEPYPGCAAGSSSSSPAAVLLGSDFMATGLSSPLRVAHGVFGALTRDRGGERLPDGRYPLGSPLPAASSAPSSGSRSPAVGLMLTVKLQVQRRQAASVVSGCMRVRTERRGGIPKARLCVVWPDAGVPHDAFCVHQYLYRLADRYELCIRLAAKPPSLSAGPAAASSSAPAPSSASQRPSQLRRRRQRAPASSDAEESEPESSSDSEPSPRQPKRRQVAAGAASASASASAAAQAGDVVCTACHRVIEQTHPDSVRRKTTDSPICNACYIREQKAGRRQREAAAAAAAAAAAEEADTEAEEEAEEEAEAVFVSDSESEE
ncbi:hypothetical protein HXX76_014035 [Chlamydomonas incerta]|uniref:Uncharacterized protein n=1 Tax=Chlamydomonas incerta TaxID=51695 RepID=A0A835SHC8_CHLIN|nr:hypothetical protein HXX76_014035 [Chlamydomonas incerta]|eukprot:KAG2424877.1 hypothetical protein HXX76_014035 [Chlamydomonas incerta]